MSFFLNPARKRNKCFILAVLLVLTGPSDLAVGQSGRRVTRPKPAGSTNPSPASTETSITDNSTLLPLGSLQQKVQLLVGRQPTQRRLQSEDAIFAAFVERLNQYGNVSATSIGDVRSEVAVDRARRESEAYVTLLKFEIDSFQSGTIILNSSDLQVEYKILAPRTARKLMKGKIYFQSIGGGRMRRSGWPNGTPIKITAEATGIEAAAHVYDWLRLVETRRRRQQR